VNRIPENRRIRNSIPAVDDDGPQKSILPNGQCGINSIMVGISGRTDRRFYAPAVSTFWRPPADVEAAISRGNKKVQASSP